MQPLLLAPFSTLTTRNLKQEPPSFVYLSCESLPGFLSLAQGKSHTKCSYMLLQCNCNRPPDCLSVFAPGVLDWGEMVPTTELSDSTWETVQWAKLPQSRTPVPRHCLKWNAVQHSFHRGPQRWPFALSFLRRLPGVFPDIFGLLFLPEVLCKDATFSFSSI